MVKGGVGVFFNLEMVVIWAYGVRMEVLFGSGRTGLNSVILGTRMVIC